MNWFTNNLTETLLVIGIALLVLEVAVLGFSTFVLFFVGLAAVVTAILTFVGVLPEDMLYSFASVAIVTCLSALFLWKPLRKMQGKVEKTTVQSDLVGHSFTLTETVSSKSPGLYRYSGIDWQLIAQEELEAGTKVKVNSADVGVFNIERAE